VEALSSVHRSDLEEAMTITKTINGNEATLAVAGWLDTQSAPEMQEELEMLEPEITSLIIDFTELEYISSYGVRQVVSAYKKMSGNIVVKNVSKEVLSIFKATGIDRKIHFD
jgi:anti-anti-sigma factor